MNERVQRRQRVGKLSGIRAVAQRAGVAVSSVSRAFATDESVSPEMRARVFEAAKAVGYVPDGVARSLRRGATSTVGCVVSNIANPTFAQIVTGAGHALQSHGYAMLIANSAEGAQNEISQLNALQRHRVDGLLLSVVDETSRDMQARLETISQQCVVLDRDLPGLSHFGRVLFEHSTGVAAAISALAELGHRRIAFIGGSPNIRPTRERADAFVRICNDLAIRNSVHPGSHTDAHAEATTHAILTGSNPPTALIAGGNQILIGMLRALRSLGLEIPGDISIVTCDEVPLMEALSPRPAVITRDLMQLGRESGEMLVSMIGGAAARTKMLPVTFRLGQSCARPRAARVRQ